jgi:hypothetical protein
MNAPKIVLPAISVGLLITARQTPASVIDFGVVAESLTVGATLYNTIGGATLAGNTIGGYTLSGLTFVGSHLNDVINGFTVSQLLTQELGAENAGTIDFNFPGSLGAFGNLTLAGGYTLSNGNVSLTPVPVTATLTACTGGAVPPPPGCHDGNTVSVNPYDPAGVVTNLKATEIIGVLVGFGADSGNTVTSQTFTVNLGTMGNDTYQAEEIKTSVTELAGTPEPASWSLDALGVALLGWLGLRRSRRS